MTPFQWIAQGVGILGIIVFLFLYHAKTIKQMLKIKLAVDIVWGIHYFLLGAIGGFSMNAVSIFREIVLMNNDKKIFKSKLWLILFILINWTVAIVSGKLGFGLLTPIVSTLSTWSFWQNNPQRARYIGLINNVLMFTYNMSVMSYTGLIAESLAFCSVIFALVKYRNNVTIS